MSAFQSQTVLSGNVKLVPVDDAMAHEIGHTLAGIDPWAHYGYPAHKLIDFLKWQDPSTRQYAIIVDGELGGTVAIRNPWLQGPYLQLLGLFPDYQTLGIGTQILNWMENEARGNSRNDAQPYARASISSVFICFEYDWFRHWTIRCRLVYGFNL